MDEVIANTFNEEVFKSKTPVLVYFTGKYCYPCKRIEPILNELSDEIGDTPYDPFEEWDQFRY